MSIREVTMYEVACDRDGCDVTTGSKGGDYTAWSDRDGALSDWEGGDDIALPDGRTYCWDCVPPDVCRFTEDSKHVVSDGECTECGADEL